MPCSRSGTRERSSSTPEPPRPAISTAELVRPAAPMSWIPTMASVFMTSRQASSRSFSVNGSPTWTVGRRCSDSSEKDADAMVAPWTPSRPVRDPT